MIGARTGRIHSGYFRTFGDAAQHVFFRASNHREEVQDVVATSDPEVEKAGWHV
jgi:hypothetical protein